MHHMLFTGPQDDHNIELSAPQPNHNVVLRPLPAYRRHDRT